MTATLRFRWIWLALALVLAASTVAYARTPDLSLRLAEFVFDPAQGEPRLPEGWDKSSAVGPDLHLVQFDGPITDLGLARLRAKGLEPVRYVYPNAYVVWGRAQDRLTLNTDPSVRWTGDFAPAYRVQPQWRSLEGTVDVRVLLVRDAGIETTIASIERLGGVPGDRFAVGDKLEVASFSLPGERMQTAARIPGVYSIQVAPTDWGSRAEVSAQLNAGNLDGTNMPIPGYPAWLAGLGLDGSGVLVGHVDEGFDELHPDLAARVAPCTGSTCSATGMPHGTHTAGIIAADATSGVLDDNGFLRGQGVAPGSGLIEQVYFPTLLEPGGMLELMRQSLANGAALSNNSWGRSNLPSGYDVHALLVDTGVRDADPVTPGNQPLIYVQALANGNGGTNTQGVPDDAKNIFTVGATRALGLDADPDPNYNDLSDVTAHGPALDGRTIPHIVAPGCRVDSTLPSGGGFDHGLRCGTSMAAANVSGAVALFVEYYRGLAGTTGDPSPALVKSAFLPVAHDLESFLDADGGTLGHRPNSKQGWGRMDLAAVVDPAPGSVLYFDQTDIFDFTGQEWMRVVIPVDPGQPMRIMLTWTDAPGHGLGGNTPAWNNDLDLVVDVDANTYLGNVFGVDGFSATGGTADPMNNAEGVFLQGLTGSEVTIRVAATNVNSDGVPNHGDGTDQDFALTCYNCAFVPDFALTATPAALDLCAPADAAYVIDAEQLAGYAEPITLSVVDVPAGANAGFDTNPVAPGGSSTLTITDTGSAVTGDYLLQIQGNTIGLSRSIPIQFNVRSGMPAPALLTLPTDSALDVGLQPVLEWDPVPWASQYLVEVTTDPTFDTIVYHAVSQGPSHRVRIVLNQLVSYFWRVRATNACGFGDFSLSRTFKTRNVPSLLLVDDDWDLPNVQHRYTQGLDGILVPYDLWDVYAVEGGNEPDAATLARYDKVIWFTGQEEVFAGPETETEQALEGWLDRSGCLMISSSDYVLNSDFSTFIQERLGVASVVEDTGQSEITGQGAVFAGLGPWALQNVNPDYSDSLTPDATAEIAFDGDMGTAAVDKDTGFYRTVFAGFGLERSPGSPDNLPGILDAFLSWCDLLPGLDGDMDGVPNDTDCVAGDPDVWTAPSPITDLMLGSSVFSWSQPVSGSGAVYDVLRSTDNTDFYNATCVAAGVPDTTAPGDLNDPAPGEVFFYLVGARNDCGLSTLGQNLDGTPRYGTACE